MEIYSFLKDKIVKYIALTPKDWEVISLKFLPIRLKKSGTYISEGKVCKKVGFIIEGALRTYHMDNDGDEVTTDFAFSGSFVTSFSSFSNQTSSIQNVSAIKDTLLLEVSYDDLQFLIKTISSFSTIYQKVMEEEFLCMENRRLLLQSKSAREKYASLLKNNREIVQKVPLIYIASYLGISPETLSRVRSKP